MNDTKLQGSKKRFPIHPLLVLAMIIGVTVFSFGDLMEIVPLFAPVVASPIFPFFHEIHDLLALGVVLYVAHKYRARLGVVLILLFLAAHVPYAVIQFSQDGPELLRILAIGFTALFGIWLVAQLRKTEKRVKQAQEYLQLQIERMPISLIIWDTQFRVQTWNPSAERIFGFTAVEAVGKHPYDIIVPKEAQPHVDTVWTQLLAGDMTAHSVNENMTRDGRTIVCDWTNTPLKKMMVPWQVFSLWFRTSPKGSSPKRELHTSLLC